MKETIFYLKQEEEKIENPDRPYLSADRHFYLYAKGHYHKQNVQEDLRHIMAERCSIPFEYCQSSDVLFELLELVFQCIQQSGNPVSTFRHFVFRLLGELSGGNMDNEAMNKALQECLSVLRWRKIQDLGEPDNSILAKNRSTNT